MPVGPVEYVTGADLYRRHDEEYPGRNCPGALILRAQIHIPGEGAYDVHECSRCGRWSFYGARKRAVIDEQKRRSTESQVRPMKLRISVHRKAGAPNYGSDGVGAELEIDLADELARDANAVVQHGKYWYGSLERMVDDQLRLMSAQHDGGRAAAAPSAPIAGPPAQAPAAIPGPPPVPAVAGGAPAGYPAPPPPAPAQQRNDPPRNGKQLCGWANKAGKYQALMDLAKSWNRPRVSDWTLDEVAHAYQHLNRPAPQPWNGG